jgi:mannitol/fructose-specific phosphotransferase system IIA component
VELEHLDTIEHDGETYMLFGIADPDNDEEMAVVIMQAVDTGDEEMLEEVQDEQLLDEVYGIFMERIEAEEAGEEDEG